MSKILCVLYPDPVDGYPSSYARNDMPVLERYPNGQTLPSPQAVGFTPGQLLGSVSGELGLREYLESQGHTLVVTSDKDGPDSVFERELADADVVISQPFWPAYLTAERIAKARNLKLAITAGIGSDHVDLQAAMEHGVTVAEVTYSNSISVAEHVVMMILALVRNYIPSYEWVIKGGWNIADCVDRSYDLEGMTVGTFGAGRIGLGVLRRLKPFDVDLHYTDKYRLDDDVERELGLTYHADAESLVRICDVVSIHTPLHPETERPLRPAAARHHEARRVPHQHGARQDLRPRRGRRGARERAARRATPATSGSRSRRRQSHPWRTMPHHGMTPHISGSSLSAQARYAAGTREILESFFAGTPIREEYLIVDGGRLAGTGAHSYTAGDATQGLEEAA